MIQSVCEALSSGCRLYLLIQLTNPAVWSRRACPVCWEARLSSWDLESGDTVTVITVLGREVDLRIAGSP